MSYTFVDSFRAGPLTVSTVKEPLRRSVHAGTTNDSTRMSQLINIIL